MRFKLPYVDLKNIKGLYTKSSPDVLEAEQLRVAENCDFFDTYGAIAKVRGTTRVLSSQYSESGVVKSIPWVEFYKAVNLTGAIDRQVLCSAGTTLAKVDGSSLTTLQSGRTQDLFHMATQLGRFMYITNYDTDKVGVGDELVKYDGKVITKWGITPPGSEEIVREAFDDSTDWTASNVTVSDESDITIDGEDGSIKLDKTITTERIFSIEKAFDSPFYVTKDERDTSKSPGNRINFWTYIPPGELTDDSVATNSFDPYEAAMAVWVSPDADTVENNHWKFYFQIGELVEGWNKLNLNFSGSPQGVLGDFYPDDSILRRIRFDFRVESQENTKSGLVLDRFVQLDEGTPIATPSGSGTFTGDYSYKVSYVSKYGSESNAGPPSRTVTTSSHGLIELRNLPVSTDPQVVARRLYRTVAGGSIYLFLDQINNNKRTDYSDIIPDGSLGVTTPPQAGDFADDNSTPPKAGIVQKWKRTVFMAGDPLNPTTLYYSEDDDPESFPLNNAFLFDNKITAIYESRAALIVETQTSKWQVIGDNPDFSVDKIVDNIGCVGRRAAGTSKLVGYAVDRDGLRLFDGNDMLKISEPIRDKYDTDIDKTNIELMHLAHSRDRNSLLQFNPDTTTPIPKYTSIFHYNYTIDDIWKGYWSTLELPSDLNVVDATEIEDSNGAYHLYVSSDDGMIFELFDDDAKNWTLADGTTQAIKTKFTTPFLRLGELGKTEGSGNESGTGRVSPRFVELRLKDNTNINWTITIESADGSAQSQTVRDSQTMTMSFSSTESLVRQSLKQNFHPGEYFRVTVETNEKDTFAIIAGLRIYFHVHPFEGQINVHSPV